MLKSQQYLTAQKVPRNRPYICNACFKQFETPSKLSRHYLIHTGQKPYQCHTCPKTFRQLVHLERHQQTHSMPFQCGTCHRSFKSFVTFLKHQQLHSEGFQATTTNPSLLSHPVRPANGPVHCPVCEKSFSTEERWVLHHCTPSSGPPPSQGRTSRSLTCDFCLKPFPSRSKLERHILIHTGQRPFACHLCGKTFRQKTHLKIHQITHMEDKPFECGFCHKRFKVQSKLFKHRQVHVRKALLPKLAGRGWVGRATAPSVHIIVDDEDDDAFKETDSWKPRNQDVAEVSSVYVIPFQCPLCEQSFETEHILKSHTCFIAEDGKVLNPGKMKLTRRSRSTRGMLSMQLRPVGDRPLITRKKRHSPFLGQLDERSGIDHGPVTRRPTSASKLVARKVMGMKRKIFKREMGQRQWPKPFGLSKRVHNHKVSPEISSGLPIATLSDEHISATGGEAIYVSSGEECDGSEIPEKGVHVPLRHRRSLQKVLSKCDLCEKIFPSLSKLRRHYLTHTGQRPFECTMCEKTFRQSAHLKRHQVTHRRKGPRRKARAQRERADPVEVRSTCVDVSSARPCPDFDEYDLTTEQIAEIKVDAEPESTLDVNANGVQAFQQNGSFFAKVEGQADSPWYDPLESPERKPATKRSHQCGVCFKVFETPSKLQRHQLVHAGQKPFQCSTCDKTFSQLPHLKRHLVTHSKVQL
ncbi:zinc finger protein 770 [Ambystoma mexicanum]|uniref:zinc finger protein 770 n=1 Tax=Ambystoma mexicanum TaxID=8296 RepID=UPI0037E811D3